MFEIRTILHPTDFSEACAYALHLASALARGQGARLIVLHVTETFTSASTAGEDPATHHLKLKRKEVLWERLRLLQAPDPELHLEHQLVEGDPATEILRAAREMSSDLIMMGLHGRTGIEYLLTGSIVERVMRDSPCPVLLMKPPGPTFPDPIE